jgi:hypothetical protein
MKSHLPITITLSSLITLGTTACLPLNSLRALSPVPTHSDTPTPSDSSRTPLSVPSAKPSLTPLPTPVPSTKPSVTPLPSPVPSPKPSVTPLPSPVPSPKPSVTPLPSPRPSASPNGKMVSVMVAVGKLGRSTISCDDGVTWIQNESENDNAECWTGSYYQYLCPVLPATNPPKYAEKETATDGCIANPKYNPYWECDHEAHSTNGIAFQNGWFVKTQGHGPPGRILRSPDGVAWELLPQAGTDTYDGITAGNGIFYAGAWVTKIATGDASVWTNGKAETWEIRNIRNSGFTPYGGGRFFQMGDLGLLYTTDNGLTKKSPSEPSVAWRPQREKPEDPEPPSCGNGFASNDDGSIILLTRGSRQICQSTDGGDHWVFGSQITGLEGIGGGLNSSVLWSGKEFIFWQAGRVYKSANGRNWTSAVMSGVSKLETVGVTQNGVFVSAYLDWTHPYSEQVFYRSIDGQNWTESREYVKSHPITYMASGRVPANSYCK